MTEARTETPPKANVIALIKAPSHLGLRPLRPDHEPQTWRAPDVLARAGLAEGLQAKSTVTLPRPPYVFAAQPGTRLRNGRTLRQFNEMVADAVAAAINDRMFPVLVGGDCSILLGALAGARRSGGELALVHVDGHSDFRHPGNYDAEAVLGAVAGMDLALATGRGEALMTDWDGRAGPLVPDERVVQIGERESRDADYAWPDVLETDITMLDIFWIREHGIPAMLDRALAILDRSPELPFWLHLDVDVVDQTVMPAVDSPGSPGLDYGEVTELLRGFIASPRCIGLDVTIFDPELDPGGEYAQQVAKMLVDGISPTLAQRGQVTV